MYDLNLQFMTKIVIHICSFLDIFKENFEENTFLFFYVNMAKNTFKSTSHYFLWSTTNFDNVLTLFCKSRKNRIFGLFQNFCLLKYYKIYFLMFLHAFRLLAMLLAPKIWKNLKTAIMNGSKWTAKGQYGFWANKNYFLK